MIYMMKYANNKAEIALSKFATFPRNDKWV